ncbi:MAG TPA: 5'-methylthioadenosine/adenosylhomocysteine nucleosidase [Geminicoccaceae bacterium]
MTVGIIAAIPQELQHLREVLAHDRVSETGGFRFDHGTLDGIEVVVAEAGIGKVNSAMVATLLASRFGADPLVFSGVAGGLDPDLAIGDLVVGERAIQHDAGVIEDQRLQVYQAGHVPFFNPTDRLGYALDPELLEAARRALAGLELAPLSSRAGGVGRPPRIVFGTILAGDQYIHCEAARERLYRDFTAHAVAMEGGAVAQVAERLGVRWLEIRALSDLAGRDSRIDFAAFVDEVAASSFAALKRLLPTVA